MSLEKKVKIVLIGGGGFATEIYSYLVDDIIAGKLEDVEISGVLDNSPDAEIFRRYPDIRYLGKLMEFNPHEGVYGIISVSSPRSRKSLYHQCVQIGLPLYSYIHSSSYVSSTSTIGNGVFVAPHCIISACSKLGNASSLNVFCGLGHGSVLGDFSTLSPYSVINGDCRIGTTTFLSSRVTVNPRITIGDNVTIDGGVIIRSDVDDYSIVSQRVPEKRFLDRIAMKFNSQK